MDSQKLAKAADLVKQDQHAEAYALVDGVLYDNPDDVGALKLQSFILSDKNDFTLAYTIAHRAAQIAPRDAAAWMSVGRAAEKLSRFSEAELSYRRAVSLSGNEDQWVASMVGLAAVVANSGRFAEAEKVCHEILKKNDSRKARCTLGIAMLGQCKWEGWRYYSEILGTDYRKIVQYNGEPIWDGSKGRVVAVYGEQGLGDEICFASMIPDAIKDSKRIIMDCDPRLQRLFQRSFPDAKVYGTRRQEALTWDEADQQLDASISAAELGQFYRTRNEDFPGAPYLIADPERRLMWRALFDSKKKPCIGIAWTSGTKTTGEAYRKLSLEHFRPVFDAIDAHWVSLQYKETDTTGYPVTTYPYATLTEDYDDTAAMVAELDLVICIHTSVNHLAGALGVPAWVLVPTQSQWRYGTEGDSIPWYKSLKLIRQKTSGEWAGPISKVVKELNALDGKRLRQAA